MRALSYRNGLFAFFITVIGMQSIGCKKTVETKTENILQQYFEQNILNRDFRVDLATDNGSDFTTDYDGYTFRLEKNTVTNSDTEGPMKAKLNGVETCTGTWSCTEEWGKLGINLTIPSTPPSFIFLNRSWKFTEKAFPIMKLAPWGSTAPKVLHMERL